MKYHIICKQKNSIRVFSNTNRIDFIFIIEENNKEKMNFIFIFFYKSKYLKYSNIRYRHSNEQHEASNQTSDFFRLIMLYFINVPFLDLFLI